MTRPGYELSDAHLPDDSVKLVDVPAMAISSTDCRARVAAGEPVWYLVPDGVVQYINKHRPLPARHRRLRAPRDRYREYARDLALVAGNAAADKLATDIVLIDVSDRLAITDIFVIATGNNERQVEAIVDEVEEKLRQAGTKPLAARAAATAAGCCSTTRTSSCTSSTREERVFYGLERLWKDCPFIPFTPDGVPRSTPSDRPARVVLLRHGRTAWNAQARFQGQADPPLDDIGRVQAYEVAALVAALRPDVLVSSDAERAMQTAEPIGQVCGLDVVPEARLRERGLGHWEGLTRDEVAERYPDEFADWLAGRDVSRRGGETREQVAARAAAPRSTSFPTSRPQCSSPTARPRWRCARRCSGCARTCTCWVRWPTATGPNCWPSITTVIARCGGCGRTTSASPASSSRCPSAPRVRRGRRRRRRLSVVT